MVFFHTTHPYKLILDNNCMVSNSVMVGMDTVVTLDTAAEATDTEVTPVLTTAGERLMLSQAMEDTGRIYAYCICYI